MPTIDLITPTAPIATPTHGGRAKCLQRLVRLDLPVPSTVALSFEMVKSIAAGHKPDLDAILNQFSPDDILCVRPSSESADWGGPSAILNIGMNDARYVELSDKLGQEAAVDLYLRFVQSYSINVARLDPDAFEHIEGQDQAALAAALHAYSDETGEEFPQRISDQLTEVLRSMSRAWEGTTARLLREAKGAPADAGLGLVVQKMAFGIGQGKAVLVSCNWWMAIQAKSASWDAMPAKVRGAMHWNNIVRHCSLRMIRAVPHFRIASLKFSQNWLNRPS